MKKVFVKRIVLMVVLMSLGIFRPSFVQAQCFHQGQAFDCKGLPDGTSSVSFNEDGTINLSNGQIVPGNFFDTPFRVQILDTTPTIIVVPSPDRPPITFFPTTADGINALTAFSHAFEGTMESFPDKKAGETDWRYIEEMYRRGYVKGLSAPYDPEAAKKLLDEAGWIAGSEGDREKSTSEPVRFGAGYKGAESAEVGWPGEHKEYKQEFSGGIEFDVARSVSLGVRYIHRSLPKVSGDLPPLYFGPEGVGKNIPLGDVRDVKLSLENGIDNMDRQNAPVPILPLFPSVESPSGTPPNFIQPGEPADHSQVM